MRSDNNVGLAEFPAELLWHGERFRSFPAGVEQVAVAARRYSLSLLYRWRGVAHFFPAVLPTAGGAGGVGRYVGARFQRRPRHLKSEGAHLFALFFDVGQGEGYCRTNRVDGFPLVDGVSVSSWVL